MHSSRVHNEPNADGSTVSHNEPWDAEDSDGEDWEWEDIDPEEEEEKKKKYQCERIYEALGVRRQGPPHNTNKQEALVVRHMGNVTNKHGETSLF